MSIILSLINQIYQQQISLPIRADVFNYVVMHVTGRHFLLFTACGTRQEADVMFVVDSANAGKKNTKKVMDFMKAVTGNMTIDTNSIQVGMVAPDPCAPNQQGFSLKEHTDKNDLVNSLNTETTDFADLVRNMRKTGFRHRAGARKGAKRVAVFIVDGELENPLETLQEAQQAREMRGIEIYVISVGTQTPQPEMMMMCDYPTQKHFYHVESYDRLEEMQDTIADVLCDGMCIVLLYGQSVLRYTHMV